MVNQDTSTLEQVKEQFRRFPAPVADEFEKAHAKMPENLNEESVVQWAKAGVEIAEQTVRSWEAAAQYYKVSHKVISYMPFNYFMRWTQCGNDLCKESPTLATAYFEASPDAMSQLRSRHIEAWAALGNSL